MVWSTPAGELLIDIVTRPGQTDHGHGGGGALAYGGKPAGAVVAAPQPRPPPAAPYAPQPYPPAQLRLHQPGYGSAALSYRLRCRDGSYARGGGAVGAAGAVGEYRGGVGVGGVGVGRMSLLGSGYLPAPAAHHPPPADPPPFKKIRLAAERPPITQLPHHQPLRVDTREPVSAYNTVEVLSPNPPSEQTIEDQSLRTTKDDLLQQISKVDREMALTENTLNQLKKKQEELEKSASNPARAEEPEEAPPRHRSLAHCIYAENRKKVRLATLGFQDFLFDAATAHGVLSNLGPEVLYPLYNQPQDTEVYHENIRRHRVFRKKLVEHIRRIKAETEKREDALAEEYSRRAAEWARRVERIEQSQKRKAKDAKNREFFEKVFPELRKQREERERFNRLGARVKSEAELEEIADGLHEQEHEDKKMRALTVVPPLLRDPNDTRPLYKDTNSLGRCMDMKAEHKELQLRNVWSQAEREIFREKYLQHPKNFGTIASFLPRKSVRDCVRFYYLSKKAENYKQVLRKPRARRSARNPARAPPEPDLPPGVTTRLQRSQGTTGRCSETKESSAEEVAGAGAGAASAAGSSSPAPAPPAAPEPACVPLPPAGTAHTFRTELTRTPPLPPSPPPASSAPLGTVTSAALSIILPPGSPAPVVPPLPPTPPATISLLDIVLPPGTSESTVTITAITVSSPTSTASSVTPSPASTSCATSTSTSTATVTAAVSATSAGGGPGSAPPTPQPAQPPTPTQPPPTPEAAVTERIGTPSITTTLTTTTVTTTSSNCAVCSMPGATRTVSRSRAVHYGLKEDAVGLRVCEPCHCRCVRSRYTRCPVPTCPGPRVRAKRLRHLPPRWHDLSSDLKKPLMDEFQIPSELSKCCLACFKRITRRLETVGEGGAAPEPTEEEAARFRSLLRDHGTAWDRIASVSGRTPASLKAFYFTYRKKLQLDSLVGERLPTAARSSSSESGVSSGDTDTASAGSPRPPAPPQHPRPPAQPSGPRTDAVAPRRTRRDEYDSSATETADEENDAPTTKILPPSSIPLPVSTPASSAPSPLPTSVVSSVSSASVSSVSSVASVSVTNATRNGPAPPQTVRDVVLNLIEFNLTRDSKPVPPPIKPHQLKVSSSTPGRETLATLTVVNSSHNVSSPRSPHRPTATITPIAQPDAPKEGVVVVHIEPRPDPRPEPRPEVMDNRPDSLLDLTVKRTDRRNDVSFSHPNKPNMYRNSNDYTYRVQPERESPNQFNPKPKPVAGGAAVPVAVGGAGVRGAKPAAAKGSITLGTPVETRFDARRTPPGSITAGTPVHAHHHLHQHASHSTHAAQPTHATHAPDKRFDHYYKRRSPAAPYYAPQHSQHPQHPQHAQHARPQDSAYSPTAGSGYSRNPHGLEQQRQIIMADFITSQQMHGGARRERQERAPERSERNERSEREHAASPQYSVQYAGAAYSPQRRDSVSVIQRHTGHAGHAGHAHGSHGTHGAHASHGAHVSHAPHAPGHLYHGPGHAQHHAHPHHAHPPPGHEAFTSLVNVASAATALPVPGGEPSKPEPKPQPSPHHHQQHEVRLREMNLPQKYHPITQYQVMDRRVKHPQYNMERDIQMAMQQRRENERAIVAMQERHVIEQHQQNHPHQQQIMHDRHHLHVQQENERRPVSAGSYTTKHRAQTPHHLDRKDNRSVVSGSVSSVASGAGGAGGAGGASGAGAVSAAAAAAAGAEARSGTLTAAELIDAIITHQISQTTDQRYPGRECDNGTGNPPTPQDRPERGPAPPDRDRDEPHAAATHTTSIKLGDLASNIITRDFCSPTTSLIHNNRFPVSNSEAYSSAVSGVTGVSSVSVAGSGAGAGGGSGGAGGGGAGASGPLVAGGAGAPAPGADEWKRRDPPKHAPYLEPVSPPDNHHANSNSNRRYGCVSGGSSGVLTAFDYVTTRIVEVMRSDADERGKPLPFPTAGYTYPYSALNVSAPHQAHAHATHATHTTHAAIDGSGAASSGGGPAAAAPEPAPLMSEQYDPLSDED
ncbi:uncharacterized protein LOC115455707 isoform X3 [Manduca sexta]|uniref:uncharacterized protein LOC115455707 isoform X3 n=1 Tax=Manduca sexta TaxID=7130 RepID=UPI0018901269|nr:uncharacterized protein LOC115455707 isoform X3 [Manduca sexta]